MSHVVTKSHCVFRDKRTDKVYRKQVLARTPEEAQRAFGHSRGGVKNVEILEFNGESVENPEQEEARRQELTPDLPSVEEIENASFKDIVAIIQHFRTVRLHAHYFNNVALNRNLPTLREFVKMRLHPKGEPPEVPPRALPL